MAAEPDRLGPDAYWEERRKLAILGRIAGSLGYIGAFGHISVRVPDTDIVLITPGAGVEKSTLRADQMYVYDINGTKLYHPPDLKAFEPLEYPIHTRIHRDKPEMLCVAHLHARNSTLLGIANKPIVPVINQAFYLHEGVPTWDNPSLVVKDEQAAELSAALGDKVACQMRGHGSVVVGETPEIGLMNCYSLEENAGYQIAAEALGGPTLFPQPVVEATARYRSAMKHDIARVLWAYYEPRVSATGPIF